MDWLKQNQEMIKLWSDTQQKLWTNWMDSMKGFAQPQESSVWEKTLETWKGAVDSMLETQAQWVRLWVSGLTATKGVPKEMIDGANQLRDMTEQWSQFQQKLWSDWFAMLGSLDWSNLAQDKKAPSSFQAWQEMLKKSMDTQMEWANKWVSGLSKESSEE